MTTAVAVGFLFSYLTPIHELRAAEMQLRDPEACVELMSLLAPLPFAACVPQRADS